jgi:hypothetical protein
MNELTNEAARLWVSRVKADSEKRGARMAAEREERAKAEVQAARQRLTPLDERLARLLATIPAELQAEGLSLTTLQGQLRARGSGHSRCHAGELGAAMRKLGFERRRSWHKSADGFRALWCKVT